MSTFAAANFGSDSEPDDRDFVPTEPRPKARARTTKRKSANGAGPAGERKRRKTSKSRDRSGGEEEESSASDTGSSSGSEAGDGVGDGVAAGAEEAEQRARREEEERRRRAAELFRSMKDEGGSGSSPAATGVGGQGGGDGEAKKMVEVKRKRRFAGEDIIETVMIPADNAEAIAFLSQTNGGPSSATSPAATPEAEAQSVDAIVNGQDPAVPVAADPNSPASTTMSSTALAPPLPKKGPPKRKPRQTLEQMAAALGGKKMTTLEKSQMDWKSHTTSDAAVQAELDANRRSGGYLQKKDFLERVQDRRDGMWESKGR